MATIHSRESKTKMKEKPEGIGENEATVTEQPKKKSIRESPSIPFVWELRPGVAKKDWKPDDNTRYVPVPQLQPSRTPPPPPPSPFLPAKLIASVPFTWEEKPGTPFRNIQQRPPPLPPLPSVKLIASIPFEWEEMPGKPFPSSHQMPETNIIASSASTLYSQVYSEKYLNEDIIDENDSYTRAWISQMDLESFSSDSDDDDDSLDSAPSLLRNRLPPMLAISNIDVLALQKNVVSEIPGSPSSESDTSSYMTGATSLADASSLVGASFLECLFPLLPPNNSGFLDKLGCSEKSSLPLVPVVNREAVLGSNGNVAVKRPHTLGELIMMSRRMSCRRKAIRMRNINLSMPMEFMKKNAFGRCLFGINTNQVGRLQGKLKTHLRLKLS